MGVEETVRKILEDIRRGGEEKLRLYSKKFDGYSGDFLVKEREFGEGEKIPEEHKRIIERMIERVKNFHKREIEEEKIFIKKGSLYGYLIRPIERIGIYVPGGKPLPSTLIMVSVPAILAGVKEIVVVSPPKDGRMNPYILYAAKRLGIREIYKIGGVQAIGAMAFGVGMRRVYKIFGPGNRFVNEAKRQVFGVVGIDKLAGPSEICVVTDGSVDKEWIEIDLLSQLEHGEDSKAYLFTTDRELFDYISIDRVNKKLFKTVRECIEEANRVSPEHLEILVEEPLRYIDFVKNAGCVYFGKYTPVSAGDYFVGTNHVLPTGGAARFEGGLGVWDFVKRIYIASLSEEEFFKERDIGIELSQVEGLKKHRESLEVRSDKKNR